jgi:hypothetical protein
MECDDFHIVVLFNRVDYEIREDHGESIVKAHYVCVCACVFYILKIVPRVCFPCHVSNPNCSLQTFP